MLGTRTRKSPASWRRKVNHHGIILDVDLKQLALEISLEVHCSQTWNECAVVANVGVDDSSICAPLLDLGSPGSDPGSGLPFLFLQPTDPARR